MATQISTAIDLTNESKDHFSELPSELLHIICAYLFPTHTEINHWQDFKNLPGPTNRPLVHLAATCKRLRLETNQWCLHFLKQHADITHYKELKTAKLQQERNFIYGRAGLITWASKHCVFCGKVSRRAAILMNGLRCCANCDKAQWPNKVTLTDAKADFDLQNYHLLSHHVAPKNAHYHMPRPLRRGSYFTSNVLTTMFLRDEVEQLARFVHGDLERHMRERKLAKEERARKKAEKAQAAEGERAAQLALPIVIDD